MGHAGDEDGQKRGGYRVPKKSVEGAPITDSTRPPKIKQRRVAVVAGAPVAEEERRAPGAVVGAGVVGAHPPAELAVHRHGHVGGHEGLHQLAQPSSPGHGERLGLRHGSRPGSTPHQHRGAAADPRASSGLDPTWSSQRPTQPVRSSSVRPACHTSTQWKCERSRPSNPTTCTTPSRPVSHSLLFRTSDGCNANRSSMSRAAAGRSPSLGGAGRREDRYSASPC